MSEGNFSDTDLAAIEAVQRVVREKIEPWAKQTDALAEFPRRQIEALAEVGVLGMNLPPQWGGPGISTLAFAACVEAIAGLAGRPPRPSPRTSSRPTPCSWAATTRCAPATFPMRRTARASALSRSPSRAPDRIRPTCAAARVPAGDGYELRGVKHFISNGGIADFIVVFAVTDPDAGHKGISAFVVDRGTQGLTAGSPERTMGLRGGHVFELSFDCRIAAVPAPGTRGKRLSDRDAGAR